MRRILFTLLGLGLLAQPLAARAEAATAQVVHLKGDAAVVAQDGQRRPLEMGQELAQGDRVVTRAGGNVTLLLQDGSELALGANTDMTLTQLETQGESHSTVFSVLEGLIKATVKKLTVGSRFELTTSHGVAAVKGTEYEARVHPKKGMEIRVAEGRVWLEDLKRERKVVIDRRKAAGMVKGRPGRLRDLKPAELRNFRRWVRESVPRDLQKEARFARFWHNLKPGQKRRFVDAAKESLGETWDDITSLKSEERQAKWKQRLRHADDLRLAGEESRVDFALGNVLIDRKGRRVRMQEFILRPNARTLQFLNYTKREGRTDLVNARHVYNRDLPRNIGDPLLRLGKKEWYVFAPTYWVVQGDVIFANATTGDNLANTTTFYDPVAGGFLKWVLPVKTSELRLNVPDIKAPGSGGLLLEQYTRWSTSGGVFTPGNNLVPVGNAITPLEALNSNLAWTDGIGHDNAGGLASAGATAPVNRNLTRHELGLLPGDIGGGFSRIYGDGTQVNLASYLIDEQGNVRNAFDLLEGTDGNLFEAMIQLAFFSFNEVEIHSNKFSQGMAGPGIDVVSKMLWWSHLTKTSDDL